VQRVDGDANACSAYSKGQGQEHKMFLKSDEIKLKDNAYFKNGVLYHGWNYGFFSCLSTCLWNLVELYTGHKIIPERIDFSRSFKDFKTEDQLSRQIDIYPLLFKRSFLEAKLCTDVLLDHHTLYSDAIIKKLSLWAKTFFMPADSIRKLQDDLCCKYSIDVNKTIVICIRGTDKATEIHNAPPDVYYALCNKILKSKRGFRIWIQTDQKQYQNYFLEKYSGQAFVIDELPVTTNSIALHLDRTLNFDRFRHGQYLVAAMNLISLCHTVITHTGNIGYWLAIYRGNLKNFYQDTTHFFESGSPKLLGKFNDLPFKRRLRDLLNHTYLGKAFKSVVCQFKSLRKDAE
jgi:hypothetical protein